jgi:hypothetical protein
MNSGSLEFIHALGLSRKGGSEKVQGRFYPGFGIRRDPSLAQKSANMAKVSAFFIVKGLRTEQSIDLSTVVSPSLKQVCRDLPSYPWRRGLRSNINITHAVSMIL